MKQWLDEWDAVPTGAEFQGPPPHEFYVTSLRATQLRALAGVYPRDPQPGASRALDPYIQRGLERERSDEIERYIRLGYPLSTLGKRRISPEERRSLQKPGWLPTAIVANVVKAGEARGGAVLQARDAVELESVPGSDVVQIKLPETWTDKDWRPAAGGIPPLEIIDGQHRLSAFDDGVIGDFDLPVVIFEGLDFSWQAYLFWTINIKPKRINASLAFDLYPLLREQEWLERGEALDVYKETRAQELTESMWSHPDSIWYDRINMVGKSGMKAHRPVTQAAFIRSLTTTFVRPFHGYHQLGGLFGGSAINDGLAWTRVQQAAYLIYAWIALADAVHGTDAPWAVSLRGESLFAVDSPRLDDAVVGPHSLLTADQGIRGFHMVANDISYVLIDETGMRDWVVDLTPRSSAESPLELAVNSVREQPAGELLRKLANALATFDWRNSRSPELSREERLYRLALRGSGGYNVMRDRLLDHLVDNADGTLRSTAEIVRDLRRG